MGLHRVVRRAFLVAVQAVSQKNLDAARSVIAMAGEVGRLSDTAAANQAQRLAVDEPNRVQAYTIEVDIIEKLKRIYYLSRRMAHTVVAEDDA
jgi:phosphate:Na+ symporter